MRAEDFHEFTRRRPFAPFRVYVFDGRVYDIRHPDQSIPMWSRVVIGVGTKDGVPDHLEHIALSHVVRLEEIATEASQGAAQSSS